MIAPYLLAGALISAFIVLIQLACRRDERSLTLASFLIHIGVAVSLYSTIGLFSPDAVTYNDQAIYLASYWSGEALSPPRVTPGKEGWPTTLAALYFITSPSPFLGLILNAGLTAACVPLILRSSRVLGASQRGARRATLFLYLPTPLLWSCLLLREPGTWFFTLLAFLGAAHLIRKKSGALRGLLLITVGLVGCFTFRASLSLILAASIAVATVITRRANGAARFGILLAAAALTPVAINFASQANYTDTEALSHSQQALGRAGSGFSGGGPLLGFARTLLGPFPWELRELSPLYALDWLQWIFILCLAVRAWRRHSPGYFPLFPPLAVLVALAVSSGNYGTMIRLRTTALILLLPLVAAYYSKDRSSDIRTTSDACASENSQPEEVESGKWNPRSRHLRPGQTRARRRAKSRRHAVSTPSGNRA